jgi:hypothetical protein
MDDLLRCHRATERATPLRIETSAGEKLLLRGDGSLSLQHPSITEKKTNTGSQFQLSVRNEKELREMLLGIKRRFPSLDVEKALQSAEKPAPSYPKGMVKSYLGAAFRDAYAIDPTTGDESRPTVVLPFGRNDLKAIYAYERIRRDVQESVFHNVIPPLLKRDRARAIQATVEDALTHALANCGAHNP